MRQIEKLLKDARADRSIIEKEIIGNNFQICIESKAISVNKEKNTAVFVMSTAQIDRYGDVVDQDSWILKYFNENPYFAWQHKSNDFPLGRWLKVWFEEDPDNIGKKRMVGEAYFAVDIDPVAKRAWDHVVDGNIRMVSVSFIPHRIDYDENLDAFILYDCELMECSLVGIGANRQALIKDADIEKIRESTVEIKKALDAKIKKSNNDVVIAHIKALGDLDRAIRNLGKI